MSRQYTAFVRGSGTLAADDDGGLLLVRDGFSWPAFLLSVPWALWHRMWIVAGGLIAAQVVLGLLAGPVGFGGLTQGAVSVGLALAMGFAGADLRGWSLQRRGFRAAQVVIAEDRDMAERRFLENHPDLVVPEGTS